MPEIDRLLDFAIFAKDVGSPPHSRACAFAPLHPELTQIALRPGSPNLTRSCSNSPSPKQKRSVNLPDRVQVLSATASSWTEILPFPELTRAFRALAAAEGPVRAGRVRDGRRQLPEGRGRGAGGGVQGGLLRQPEKLSPRRVWPGLPPLSLFLLFFFLVILLPPPSSLSLIHI
eukprot:276712-Rhodomonas_salina.3